MFSIALSLTILSTAYAIYCNYRYHKLGDKKSITEDEIVKIIKLDRDCEFFTMLTIILAGIAFILI